MNGPEPDQPQDEMSVSDDRTLETSPGTGRLVASRYRLERVLGRGGMGAVWSAWDGQLERMVAVKFMSSEVASKPALRERFNREAKAAAKLRTRHVTQVFDFGVDEQTPFIVMEYLDGEDLRTVLKRTKRLPLREVARIVVQTAKALSRASEAGIVHRDLKPGNVFLARVDDEEIVKVLDFGVAKLDGRGGESTTKSGVVLGSPPYLSPEQARGNPVDQRTDLWALAAVAYRAITGRTPFVGKTDADVVVKICTEDPPPPSHHVKNVPAPVDAFFHKAFQKEPEGRFQTPEEFARGFAAAVGIEVVSLPGGRSLSGSSGGFTPISNPSGPISAALEPHTGVNDDVISHAPISVPSVQITPVSGYGAGVSPSVRTPPPMTQSQDDLPAPRKGVGRIAMLGAVAAVLGAGAVVFATSVWRGDDAAADSPAAAELAPESQAGEPSAASAAASETAEPDEHAADAASAQASSEPGAQPQAQPSAQASSEPKPAESAKPPPKPAVRRAPPPPKKPKWGY